MSDEIRGLRDQHNELLYQQSHILNLLISIEGVRKIVHAAKGISKINFAERPYKVWLGGSAEEFADMNCLKFERFFLDYYEAVPAQGFLEVPREEVTS